MVSPFPRFPFPPSPPGMKSFFVEEEIDDETDDNETDDEVDNGKSKELPKSNKESAEERFRSQKLSEGYSPQLVEMGVKVFKNHNAGEERAAEIAGNWLKEASR